MDFITEIFCAYPRVSCVEINDVVFRTHKTFVNESSVHSHHRHLQQSNVKCTLSLSTTVSCQLICRLDAHLGELQTRSSVAHLAVDAVDAEVAVVGVGPPVPGLDVAPQRPDDAGAGGEAGPHVAAGGGAAARVPGLERGLG